MMNNFASTILILTVLASCTFQISETKNQNFEKNSIE